MNKYTSKTGKINKSDKTIYSFLTNFNNFKSLIPDGKITDFTSNEDSCRFKITGIGEAGLKILEKEPFKLIKITSDGKTPFNFLFWIQLKPVDDDSLSTAVRLTLEADLNPMMKMMIGNYMQKGMDTIVDYMVKFFNEQIREE